MHHPSPSAGAFASIDSGRPMTLGDRWAAAASEPLEHTRLIEQARTTEAAAQLRRCCPSAARVLESVSWRALTRLAANEPVDPNEPDSWRSPDAHARIVLRRHGITGLDSTRLTMDAVRALIDGQARADRDAGLDWTRLAGPTARLDAALRRAHARLPIGLDDPAIYAHRDDQRRALAARLGVAGEQAGDLSRWLLGHPDAFEASDLRCWRIASATWLALAGEQLPAVERVERPVGLFLAPAERGDGWQLAPVLSLDAIRLVDSLGGRVEYDLRSAVLPLSAGTEVFERVNQRTLHAVAPPCRASRLPSLPARAPLRARPRDALEPRARRRPARRPDRPHRGAAASAQGDRLPPARPPPAGADRLRRRLERSRTPAARRRLGPPRTAPSGRDRRRRTRARARRPRPAARDRRAGGPLERGVRA